ncbi:MULTISPECIES: hypothetical protein [unclassified Acidovorax]|jgi:hypothetical protein|uniref:hypothetical protein n=1 Tax=unclassified Acidovorax TaxID=2684926 RepID=UPI00023FC8F4|nr:hypothetical protein [Acidovorax sp. NO-1]EHL20767.1 hypothetical protein KYG_21354 [Acidovorax sp. NO-1]
MKIRYTLAAALLGKFHHVLEAVRTLLAAPARSALQPVRIQTKAERRLRAGHLPGRYRHYD